jgi:hypothetical protein
MKRRVFLITFCAIIASLSLYAQSPESFNYQAVLRDGSGELIANQEVEIQISIINNNAGGAELYSETHTKTTNAYGLVNILVGTGTTSDNFSDIDWAADKRFIGVKVDAGSGLTDLGAFELLSVPYSLHASTASNFSSENIYIPQPDTLFAVKDNSGNVVFAVFPDGVKVIVEESTKGTVGGFAVSGRSPTKSEKDIFRVTPDSTRIFVNDTIQSKGRVGGFAVSGRSPTKGISKEYLIVTQDSTRVYINDTALTKGRVGGFAVSGRSPTKSGVNDYFNISGNQEVETVNNESRILWYPKKEAFLTGRVTVLSPSDVGTNSLATGYNSQAIGDYSQAMGYKSIARGAYSTAIGYQALTNDSNSFAFGNYAEALGVNSFAFGDSAIVTGEDAYAIGAYAYASGRASFAIGSKDRYVTDNTELRTTALGDLSLAVGLDADAIGYKAVAVGSEVHAYGDYSVALGRSSTARGMFGFAMKGGNAIGSGALAIGGQASGYGSIAINGEAKAWSSIAIGSISEAKSSYSLALGYNATTTGKYATAIGSNATAQAAHSFVIGYWNKLEGDTSLYYETDPLFVIGNGKSYLRANAFSVLNNGQTAVGNMTPEARLHVHSNEDEDGFRVDIADTLRFIVKSDGKTAIGTSIPNSKLHVNAPTGENGLRVQINGSTKLLVNSSGGVSVGTPTLAPTNGLYVLGNAGIGVSSPSQKLDVNGNARFRSIGSGTYDRPLNVTSDGTLTTQSSDVRLKENISTIENSLQKVQNLRGVNFTWKSEPEMGKRIGFIAQEVEKVIPELVFTNEVDGYKGVNYAEMSAVLVEAVKELKTENDTLKKQLLELNEKLEKIEQMLENK